MFMLILIDDDFSHLYIPTEQIYVSQQWNKISTVIFFYITIYFDRLYGDTSKPVYNEDVGLRKRLSLLGSWVYILCPLVFT